MDSEGEDEIIQEHETQLNEENDEQQVEQVENEATEDNREDEDKEKKVIKVKRRNPQPKLNAETLKGARGVSALPGIFEKRKFKGKGHEEEDLRQLIKTYEYWCHRMFPKYPFDECVERIEKLGYKRPVITLIKKTRMNLLGDETEQQDGIINEDEEEEEPPQSNVETRFDDLLERQPVAPKQLTEEQLGRIRVNKERAQKLRQERLRKIQEQAESKLETSSELPVRERAIDSQVYQNEVPNEINTIMNEDIEDHAENIEANVEDIEGHAENLEANVEDIEGHAENLEANVEDIEGHAENIEANVEDIEGHAENNEDLMEDIVNTQGSLGEEFANEFGEEPLSQVIGSNRFSRTEFQVKKNKAFAGTLNIDLGDKSADNNDEETSEMEEEITCNEDNSQKLKIPDEAMEIH